MSISKREGAVAIAYQAAPETAAAAPVFDIICDDANIPGEPNRYERVNNVTAESLGMQDGGIDNTFSVDGIEPNAELMGYLLWLFGGGYARPTTIHEISQVFDSKYFTLFKDQGAVFSGTDQVLTGIGCRMDNLTIDQQAKAFAKVSMSGMCCDRGIDADDLAPSIGLTAAEAPLSWAALAAGTFDIGYDTLTCTTDDNVTGVKLTLGRALSYGGTDLASNQPAGITQGGREVLVEYTRDFTGNAAALAEYSAFLTGTAFISLNWQWLMSTSYVDIVVPHVKVTGDPMPSVGTGEDTQVLTVSGKAYMNASSNIMDITTVDGNETVDFDAL